MEVGATLSPEAIEVYLRGRSRWVRCAQWLGRRRYRVIRFPCPRAEAPEGRWRRPLIVVASSARDVAKSHEIALGIERDWLAVPAACRQAYSDILGQAPEIVVIQLRRRNVCGCLGHRHVVVKEAPFAEPHEALGRAAVGEMDLAYERIATWPALPLTDSAFDARFIDGSRQQEFRAEQFRLRLLSVLLHEIHHLVFPTEREESVRQRSLSFYRDALASYVENACATLSFTIDRSFSRLE